MSSKYEDKLLNFPYNHAVEILSQRMMMMMKIGEKPRFFNKTNDLQMWSTLSFSMLTEVLSPGGFLRFSEKTTFQRPQPDQNCSSLKNRHRKKNTHLRFIRNTAFPSPTYILTSRLSHFTLKLGGDGGENQLRKMVLE